MTMEMLREVMGMFQTGGWIAFSGFGLYLGYKLAFTTVICYSIVNVIRKIIDYLQSRHDLDQKLIQLANNAGMSWPLTLEQWEVLNLRVKQR